MNIFNMAHNVGFLWVGFVADGAKIATLAAVEVDVLF